MIWRTERSNHAGGIVLNIENINRLFSIAAFKIHLAQKTEGARAPHFEWAWRLWVKVQLKRELLIIFHGPRLKT